MANRYWVGGTASWDGTAGTKWALTSGGAGGQAVPTSADDVFFDGASGASTVTIATGNTGAKSITCTGFTGTLTGSANLTVAGSVTLVAGMTFTWSGILTTTAACTLTSAGKSFTGAWTIDATGASVDLADAAIFSLNCTLTNGTLNTNGFNISCQTFQSSNTNTRTINLSNSTITCTGAATAVNFTTTTNLTFNANTSQINCSGNGPAFIGGGLTFYNVSFTSTTASGSGTIQGANTFTNLTVTAPTTGQTTVALSADQVVSGTFTCAGASAIRRNYIKSDTLGTTRTITAATLSANDCDFRDITIAGAAAGGSPTRAGDCGGNSGITFPAAKTVYRVGTNATWAGSSSWATSSGGAGADTNFPLPQDTAVIDNATTTSGNFIISGYNISAVDTSARTTAYPISFSNFFDIYGSFSFGSGVSQVSGVGTVTFSGRKVMDFTTAGKTIIFPIVIAAPGGTLRLLDAYTSTNAAGNTLTNGTLNLNNFTFTTVIFSSTNSNTRTLAFGTGNITVTGSGLVWTNAITTNLTVTGTPVVNVTNSTATATTVSPGSPTEGNSISFNFTAGTYSLNLNAGVVRNVDFTGFAGTLNNLVRTIYGNFTASTGMTLTAGTNTQTFAATSGTKTINSVGKTFDFPVTFDGAGGTWQLVTNDLTIGATRTLTHTNGTLDLNGRTLTIGSTGSYTTAAGTKNLTFNGGTLSVTASGATAFNNAQPTNFTTTAGTGTGKISMTSASAKTFVGGGSTYNCTLSNDGAGALTITGSNTFTTLANGVQPTTFTFTAGTTTTLTNWNVSGTAGNLVTIGSATAASHTLSKSSGTVSADYLSISRSTATGGATWYAGANSTNGGNNTGWIFTAPPVGAANANFFLLF